MKLIQIFQKLNQFLTKLINNDLYIKSFISICFLALIAVIIWLGGPYITWQNTMPFTQPEKRIYLILFVTLIWFLKFLIIDLDTPNALQFKNAETRKKLNELQKRFQGALAFLKKATLARHGKTFRLNSLPWYLLIGPENAGKTSLLANSQVHFVLQRQFQHQNVHELEKSENCDWWVTKDACIIDVPGQYITTESHLNDANQKGNDYPILWRFFLRLIKKYRKKGIQGIILALPLPEIMKEADSKKYHFMLRQLFQRVHELQKYFNQAIPCHIVITKCDQLPGFAEFFAETSDDEIIQAWGITLPSKKSPKLEEVFIQRFNALIKKLNQQLLWRLHQERNPLARPYIKDFPLQVERVKSFTLDLLKKIHTTPLKLSIKSIYLTSALQNESTEESTIIDETINTTQRAVQIFKTPVAASRAFFIKQFILHGLGHARAHHAPDVSWQQWTKRMAYTTAIGGIGITTFFLAQDFQQGLKHTYALQEKLAEYQLSVQQFHIPEERLSKALYLMNTLQQSTEKTKFKLDLFHLLTFYSHKSRQNANTAYYQSLQTILLPEVRNYLAENLKNPINRNTETVYSTLKAYLMLGDATHLQPAFVLDVIHQLLPQSMNENEATQLMNHLNLALKTLQKPLTLDDELINQTRRYFISMPSFRLGYIILKNTNDNNSGSEINLGLQNKNLPVFISQQNIHPIPTMFTVKAFSNIITQQASIAANESVMGNWVLGNNFTNHHEAAEILAEQLKTEYVNNYVSMWENILTKIHIATPSNLFEADQLIVELISNDSPLLHLLQTLHDNTYFEPIASASPKLQNVSLLIDRNNSANQLFEIISSLQSLHQYLQVVITAENQKKAAFEMISNRLKNLGTPDAIIRLRLVAAKSPEPVKGWLEKVANNTWHFLMQDASRYLDTAWQDQVIHIYKTDIANRYPFNSNVNQEVDIHHFVRFFGNPGIIINFYNTYLRSLVDTSSTDWHWKVLDNNKLPFSDETLRHLQHAIRIHHSFFPKGDNKLQVQFALQPYKIGKNIKSIKLNIYDNQFTDDGINPKSTHIISWPNNKYSALTSVQLIMANHQIFNRHFSGAWGWLKLLNQSFESVVTKKQMLINLSMNENPAQYLLLTHGQFNPFLSLNLRHFNLPQQITDLSE